MNVIENIIFLEEIMRKLKIGRGNIVLTVNFKSQNYIIEFNVE